MSSTNKDKLPELVRQRNEVQAALDGLKDAMKEQIREAKAHNDGDGSYDDNVAELQHKLEVLDIAVSDAADHPDQILMDV